jgi:hypothetical protein
MTRDEFIIHVYCLVEENMTALEGIKIRGAGFSPWAF